MKNWTSIKTVTDGEKYEVDGLNIWNHKWIETGKKLNVKDPLYGKRFNFTIYKIENSDIKFAAGEFSNCVWGICEKVN